ncbi:hypothetical protein SDC9_186127 [bioreactor metagenome]|uniref:Uncharacterized protein n=1 Tax=bioreactor metagenome TaxID=1076179 RepID=A0A645HT93_9ZZZZ
MLGLMHPRGINKYNLLVPSSKYALYSGSGSLGLLRNNGNFGAYNFINQCGFSHIRSANNTNKSRLHYYLSLLHGSSGSKVEAFAVMLPSDNSSADVVGSYKEKIWGSISRK